MAKKRTVTRGNEYSPERYSQGIQDQDVMVYTKDRVVLYGVNVSVLRSIGTLMDGLPPIRRRILYLMYHDEGLLPTKSYAKVPEWLLGVAKYHPHGDQSVGKTFDSMIKEWETNAALIDVMGNSGSVTGDAAAAYRYLDARLSLYAYKCFFEEFDEDAVEMIPNYLRTCMEPLWLPAKYPNFLLSVSTGIAWGNNMNYAPFNLVEAFELTKALIKNPEMTDVYLFPDSPRGYEIIDDGTAVDVCNAGHGTFKIRAVLTPGTDDKGVPYIDVSGFPEGVTMDDTMSAIAKLINEKAIFGIEDASDLSNLEETYYRLHLKKGVDPKHVIGQLYGNKKTKLTGICQLEFNFAERTYVIHLSLKDAILEWVERRIDYLQRYYIRKLNNYEKRYHEYEGLLAVMSEANFTKASRIIHKSQDDEEMIQNLMSAFKISSMQAEAVSRLTLRQNTVSKREALKKEIDAIPVTIREIRELIQSRENLEQKICDDLDEGIKLFGRPRVCKVVGKDTINHKPLPFRVLVTQSSVKKMMTGSNAVGLVQDEIIGYYPEVTENDLLLVLNSSGYFFNLDIAKLAMSDAGHRGASLLDAIGMGGNCVLSVLVKEKELKKVGSKTVVMFTKKGIIKATKLEEFIKCKSNLQGIVLDENDEVCYAMVLGRGEDTNRLIYTKKGMGLIVDLKHVTTTARVTKGTTHLALDDDEVAGVCAANTDRVFILTTKGYGKLCALDSILTAKKRKADMIRLTSLSDGDEVFRIIPADSLFDHAKFVVHMAQGGKIELAGSDIKETTRISKGYKLIPVKRGDSIVRIRTV